MKSMSKKLVLVVAATVATLGSAGVMAAGEQPAPPPQQQGGRPPMGQPMGPEAMKARAQERVEALGTALKLKPEQKSAWDAYKDAVLNRGAMARPAPGERPQNAIEAIKRREDMARKHLEALEKQRKAAETLYAKLDAEQKATFDAESQGRGRGGPRGPRQGGER